VEVGWALQEVAMGQEADMVVRLSGPQVDLWAERAALEATVLASHKERIALHAGSIAEAAERAAARCHMSALVRGSIYKKQLTSTSGMVETSMSCGQEEISPASSRAVAF